MHLGQRPVLLDRFGLQRLERHQHLRQQRRLSKLPFPPGGERRHDPLLGRGRQLFLGGLAGLFRLNQRECFELAYQRRHSDRPHDGLAMPV